jgi:hypothetical protein
LVGRHVWSIAGRTRRLKSLGTRLAEGNIGIMAEEADAYLKKRHLQLDRGDPRYRELCTALMRGEIELLRRTADRDAGDFTGTIKDPILREPTDPVAEIDGPGIMIMFDRFKRQNPNNVRPETMRRVERDVPHFAEFVGPRVRARNITKAMSRPGLICSTTGR